MGTMMQLKGYTTGTFDRGAPRWKEALWVIARNLFFLTGWPWPSALRVSLLRLFGASVGEGVVIRANVNITFPWRFAVGDHVWLGEEVCVLSLAHVTVGSHVCISQRAFLCTGSHRYQVPTFDLKTAPISIGSNCWIAAQAFIAPGVKIGVGSVIGAGSIVLESVAAGVLVQGNPAKPVKVINEQ
jgi:putative colanic acid biosynthesis acetyltransferase WcaF